MLRTALAALQSRKKEKKGSTAKPLTAPAKFKLLRLKRKGAIGTTGEAKAAAAPQKPSPSTSPLAVAPMLPPNLRARLSAAASSLSQILLLLAQVVSLFLTFYLSFVRLVLDFPLSLSATIAKTAAAAFFNSRPVAAAAAAAGRAASAARARVPARLLGLLPAAAAAAKQPAPGCVFYECVLHHRRLRPARHEFEYRVRMALLDLDAPPRWFSPSGGRTRASRGGRSGAHLSASEAREAAGLPPGSRGPVWLLTMPPAAGYSQNPISVYYCYAEGREGEGEGARSGGGAAAGGGGPLPSSSLRMPPAGAPVAAVAEVTNTPWGSVARFSFDPAGDSVPKCLHVSPFMDMRNEWRLAAPAPGRGLALSVAALHPELGPFFSAALVGRVDSSPRTRGCLAERSGSLRTFWEYAYGPQRVALWIYGHAAVLFWRKRLSVFGPPDLGAGARRAREVAGGGGDGDGGRRRKKGGSALSSSSSSSSLTRNAARWHEWIAAREWPWRVGACGI